MTEYDIIIEQDDVRIVNGDFSLDSANNQTIKHIEISESNFYISPLMGVALYKLQNSPVTDYRTFTGKTIDELKKDGFSRVDVAGSYDTGTEKTKLEITAVRINAPTRYSIPQVEDIDTDKKDIVRYSQSLYDFAIWKYGTVEGIVKLARDNGLKYDSDVYQGQELFYSSSTGNEDAKDYLSRNNIIPVSNIDNYSAGAVVSEEENPQLNQENDIIIEQDDVKIISGDFYLESANNQTIKHVEIAEAGNFYITPTLGVAIYKLQNSPIVDYRGFTGKTIKELEKDGFNQVDVSGTYDTGTEKTELKITAVRIKRPIRQTIAQVEETDIEDTDVVRSTQSLYDFAIWKYGTVEGIVRLARENGLRYDSDVTQGQELKYTKSTGNEDIKDFFVRNSIIPISNIDNLKREKLFVFEDEIGYDFEDDKGYKFED